MPSQDKLARNAKRLGLRVETYKNIREGRILALADINALMLTPDGTQYSPSTSFAQRNGSIAESTIRQRYALMSHMIGVGQKVMQTRPAGERLELKKIGPHFDEKAKALSLQGNIMRQMHLAQPEPPIMAETPQNRSGKQTYFKAIARNMVGGVALLKQGRPHHG